MAFRQLPLNTIWSVQKWPIAALKLQILVEEISQAPKYPLSYFSRAFQVMESFDLILPIHVNRSTVQTWIRTLYKQRKHIV